MTTATQVYSGNSHPSRHLMNQNSRTIHIEYMGERLLSIALSNNPNTFETTTQLFQKVITGFRSWSKTQPSQINVSRIVALETKDKDLGTDHLLSLEKHSVNFLREGTVLVPYFAKESTSSTPDSHYAIGLEDFEFLAKLGEGGFATVYLARMIRTGKFYAIKQIKKKDLSVQQRKNLVQEKDSMIVAKDPFVLNLHIAFQTVISQLNDEADLFHFSKKDFCYLVMDYMPGGDLIRHFSKKQRFNEEKSKFYVAEIALGLKSLHEKNIIYRDLKPENVLIDENGHICLGDFGLSTKFNNGELNHSICGTPQFIAPEVYKKTGYSYMADYFSLGVLAFELTVGKPPFDGKDINEVAKKITSERPTMPLGVSKDFQDFIAKILEKEPSKRLGAKDGIKELLTHPWFSSLDMQELAQKNLAAPVPLKRLNPKNLASDFSPEKIYLNLTSIIQDDSHLSGQMRLPYFSYYPSLKKGQITDRNNLSTNVNSFEEEEEMDGTEENQNSAEMCPKNISAYILKAQSKKIKKTIC